MIIDFSKIGDKKNNGGRNEVQKFVLGLKKKYRREIFNKEENKNNKNFGYSINKNNEMKERDQYLRQSLDNNYLDKYQNKSIDKYQDKPVDKFIGKFLNK